MTTYYRNGAGRIVVSSPWKYVDYWNRTREFNPSDYSGTKGVQETVASTAGRAD
ncbi:hypothetical protein [Mycolicibacterium sp. CH28]|uniref:hypothetical protein n=1 Tax=Mycolicibacterium sp. CH28 TaxID=2512237 RepID=UPI001F21653C|nr:hypothetical protein [Mycolicibacterium sp. CH28]